MNASQILAMGAPMPRAVPAVPAVPLFTNNPLGENQLTAMPVPTPKQMSVQTIATQTEKQIEEVKPMFRRVNATVEVPKPKSIATSSGSYTNITTPSRSNAEMMLLLKKVV
jgi:hypothetical protein